MNGSVWGSASDKFRLLASSKWLRVDLGSSQAIKRLVGHAGRR